MHPRLSLIRTRVLDPRRARARLHEECVGSLMSLDG